MTATPPERFLAGRIKLQQLAFLVALDEQRSLARAATLLNMTQPGATKTLKEIERVLGVALFERSRRGVQPTPFGLIALRSARAVLGELRQLDGDLAAARDGLEGRVVVGSLLAAAAQLLPRSIALMRRRFPGVTVRVVEGTWDALLPMLRTGDLDLVLGRVPSAQQRRGLVVTDLYDEPTMIVARPHHPLAEGGTLAVDALLAADWILPSDQTMLRRDIELAFRAAGRDAPLPAVESVAALANHNLILQSDLLAFLPQSVASFFVGAGLLAVLDTALVLPPTRTGLILRAQRALGPAPAHFAAAVREVAGGIT